MGRLASMEVMAQRHGGVRQGASCPSTRSTVATVSIFLGRDSEARELCAELEVIHALTGCGHNVLRKKPCEYVVDDVIFNQGVGACCKTASASYPISSYNNLTQCL